LGILPEAGQGAHIVTKLRGLWLSNQNLGLYEEYHGLSKTLPDLTRDTSGLLIATRRSIDVALEILERRASRLHYGVTTSALASRLRASWMAATVTKVAKGFGMVLEVLGKTPVSPEPGESPLDDPAMRQDDEALMSSLRLTISMRNNFATATPCSCGRLGSVRAKGNAGGCCRGPGWRRLDELDGHHRGASDERADLAF
jgi:hypothetical protein